MKSKDSVLFLAAGSVAVLLSAGFLVSGGRASSLSVNFFNYRQASTGLDLGASGLLVFDVTDDDEIIARDDWDSTFEGVSKDTEVTANDTFENGAINLSVVSGPLNGSAVPKNKFVITYTPNANYTGTDLYRYRICSEDDDDGDGIGDDDGGCSEANVTIQVQGNNAPPVANGDAYSVQINGTLTVSAPGVLNNDTDPDGDPLTAILDDQTDNGTLVFNTSGSFTYTPFANFAGEDKFVYRASDGDLESNQAEVVINVSASDTQQPSVTWTSPVSNQDVHTVNDRIVVLEVQASDNQAVDRVLFYRWDAMQETYVDLATVTAPPYSLELDTGTLNLGWNQISARAYDNVGNPSEVGYIWLYKVVEFFLPVALR